MLCWERNNTYICAQLCEFHFVVLQASSVSLSCGSSSSQCRLSLLWEIKLVVRWSNSSQGKRFVHSESFFQCDFILYLTRPPQCVSIFGLTGQFLSKSPCIHKKYLKFIPHHDKNIVAQILILSLASPYTVLSGPFGQTLVVECRYHTPVTTILDFWTRNFLSAVIRKGASNHSCIFSLMSLKTSNILGYMLKLKKCFVKFHEIYVCSF